MADLEQLGRRTLCAITVVVSLAVSAAHAIASDLSPRQLEIIRTVLGADGYVSPQLHAEFWSQMPAEVRRDPKFARALHYIIDNTGVPFQRETWASTKASLSARRVVKTPDYESARKSVLNAPPLPEIERAVNNAEAMIRAAAEGTPFQTPRGPLYVTQELVDQVLSGLDGSIARFRLLAAPEWAPEVTETRYPEARVTILSEVPFALKRETLTADNRGPVTVITLSNRLSEVDRLGVSYAHGSPLADPRGAVIGAAKGGIRSTGAEPISPILASQWRGHVSATGAGKADTSEGALFVSMRTVELRQQAGLLSLFALSGKSKLDADALLDNLERALQVID